MTIGTCGTLCLLCRQYIQRECTGCIRELNAPRQLRGKPCPILRCAKDNGINYCIRDCSKDGCELIPNGHHAESRSATPCDGPALTIEHPASNCGGPAPQNSGSLRVYSLGGLRVFRGSHQVSNSEWSQGAGATRKIKALFAYLLHQGSGGASRDEIVSFIWPQCSESSRSAASLHLALYCLRRALEPDLCAGQSSSFVHYVDGRYVFEPVEPIWTDAEAFANECARALALDDQSTETIVSHWAVALSLYHGDYMAGLATEYNETWDDDCFLQRRQQLRQLYLIALVEMARCQRIMGHPGASRQYARRALELEPGLPSAIRHLIMSMVEAGYPHLATITQHLHQSQAGS